MNQILFSNAAANEQAEHNRLLNIQALVLDLDGFLWDYPDDINDLMGLAKVLAARELGIDEGILSDRDIIDGGQRTHTEHRDGLLHLMHMGPDDDSHRAYAHAVLQVYHRHAFNIMMNAYPDRFLPDPETVELLHKLHCEHRLKIVVLTQACSTHWAKPCIEKLGLSKSGIRIFGGEHAEYDPAARCFPVKGTSTVPLYNVLAELGLQPANALFGEDSAANLAQARKLGDTYNLLRSPVAPDQLPPYIDKHVSHPKQFLKPFLEVQENARRAYWKRADRFSHGYRLRDLRT